MVNTRPAVTVGMPVYNDPDGLRRSVPTVFAQTWDGDLRLLLIDDGSDAETVAVIEELRAVHGRIDVVRNEVNRGRPHVRNQILEHAGDGYLTWLDSGDLLHPRKVELQVGALEAADVEHDGPLLCTCAIRRYFLDTDDERIRTSEVTGDQLYNVLAGKLYPYLPTMLGRTAAFRSVGSFDERLLRRQDYDLIVRFIAAGGRVISTPDDQPLFTYVKSDAGSSARKVATASRIIRRKHRDLYRRYGRSFAWEMRAKQHLLAARFHDHNEERLRAGLYRLRASLSDPVVLRVAARPVGWARRSLRRSLTRARPVIRDAVRALSRRSLTVMPLLRRLGVTSLARKLGLVRLAATLGVMRVFYEEVHTADEPEPTDRAAPDVGARVAAQRIDSVVTAARRAMQRGEPGAAADLLERLVGADAELRETEVWLLLERAYREAGRLHSAQSALDRGLERSPGDRDLQIRSIELLGLRRDWKGCVKRWNAVRAEGEDDLTPRAHSRVARSHRELGDHATALGVAAAGLGRWPEDRSIRKEFHRNRAATVDWARALRPVRPRWTSGDDDPVGEVTDPGFLTARPGPLQGHVSASYERAPRVCLLVNGREVACTYATSTEQVGAERRRSFSLSCDALLHYLGDGDVLAVECDGAPVVVDDGAVRLVAVTGFESRFAELEARLDAGYVFTKFGALRLGHTPERKRAVFALYDEIAALLEEEFGYALYPFYGNLLGAVREHDFIEHDVGGFDIGYVSRHGDAHAVREEFQRICAMLGARGYHLRLEPWSTYIRAGRADKVFVDLNFAWFNTAGELNLSYGWRWRPVTDRQRFYAPRDCPMGLHLVRIPGNAEAVLDQIYGPGWAVPDQGFAPDRGIVRDTDYLLTGAQMEELWRRDPDRFEIWSVLTTQGEVVRVG